MLGLELTDQCAEQMLRYLQLLVKWNKVYNLTAITEPESMVIYHLLDSLSIARHIKGKNLLDVGAGAGLPGIPLAMLYPQLQVTLLDSNGKKIRFVTQVVIDLGLANVKVVQSRIESYQPGEDVDIPDSGNTCFDNKIFDNKVFDNGFDNIVCRAFSDLKTFRDQTDRLVSAQGQRLAMKGKSHQQQVEDGWTSIKLDLPFTNDQRHIKIC